MRGKKLKYEPVADENNEDITTTDALPEKDPNRNCSDYLWSSLFTGVIIGTYYIPSICLTFYQRWLFQSFHFPLMTVLGHMIIKYILAAFSRMLFQSRHRKKRVMLGWREYIIAVAPMGIFSGLDIGFSNWGLELIKVSLYTMTKSTTIVFILFFSILFKLEKKSWSLCVIVVMITLGLILFTYKDTQFDFLGFFLLLLASMSSGIRWTCVQILLQKSKIGMTNPIDMIYHMQPFMMVSVLPFALWMEGPTVVKNCQTFTYTELHLLSLMLCKILLGALLAFVMEVTELTVVQYTSSLTLAIAGIFKEVFILVIAIEWNGDQMSQINLVGLLICLSGIICHVIHKIQTTAPVVVHHKGVYEAGFNNTELSQHLLMNNSESQLLNNSPYEVNYSDDSDDLEKTDILFDILKRRGSDR